MNKLVLVDGNSMIFKAYYATAYTGNLMMSPDGRATNAIHAMANMMFKILKERKPDHILVAFDKGKKTIRHESMPDYKAGRSKTPDELRSQFPLAKEMLKQMGITIYEQENYEADDIIGTLARRGEEQGYKVEVFSSDKDLLQLSDTNTTVFLTHKGISQIEPMTPEAIDAKWGITPRQVVDMKGIMGDKSDNIPGIPGIGEKGALKLLHAYGTLENVYENIEEITGATQRKLIEHKALGMLSKEIATIICDMDLPMTVDQTVYTGLKNQELAEFFLDLGMNTMVKRLNFDVTKTSTVTTKQIKEVELSMLLADTSLYCEVYDDNYNKSFIVGFGISNKTGNYYISAEDAHKDELFKKWLANPAATKIVFETTKTINAMRWEGLEINGIIFDVQIAAYVLNHKLKMNMTSIEQYFVNEITVMDGELVYGKGAKKAMPTDEQLTKHVGSLASSLERCYKKAKTMLVENNQTELFEGMEMKMAFALADMEFAGITMDRSVLREVGEDAKAILAKTEKEIFKIVGEEFNVASPKQLGEILFDKLGLTENKKRSTAVKELLKLMDESEVIKHVLIHRKYSKLLSTYVNGIEEYIGEDNKIHGVFNQTLTQTGRLSSKYPNLQNISVRDEEQRKIRKAFVASPGNVLVAADYSQIELRVLAHMANADHLIESFEKGIDIHTKTAADVFGIDISKVTTDQRRKAKAVNFGIIYGISEFGLSEQLLIPVWEAKEIIAKYLEAYPAIDNFRNEVIEKAKEDGYVSTIANRKRYIPELTDNNHMTRQFGKRAAMNAPIQGSAADIIKLAMVHVADKLKEEKLETTIILQVHDELVFDTPKSELEKVKTLVREVMENVIKLKVDLAVDIETGANLFEAK